MRRPIQTPASIKKNITYKMFATFSSQALNASIEYVSIKTGKGGNGKDKGICAGKHMLCCSCATSIESIPYVS